jgi:radical SAM protein with 4Fe4S-binding SPASM domain
VTSQAVRPRRAYAVWELTLACNLACRHCGSRAGTRREHELSTAEALALVRQLSDLGIDEVTVIGGEAFLRRDWPDIVAEIVRRGMVCTMTTGAYRLGPELAHRIAASGISQVSVSVDGLEATHDRLRGRTGSFRWCLAGIRHLQEAGLPVAANTQINRLSAPELPLVYQTLHAAGIVAWQIQLTVPMGRAADEAAILLQPVELLDVFPVLARIAERAAQDGVRLHVGNNVGYFGPYAGLRGGAGPSGGWSGCQAGLTTLGIEANGTIKGCPSLPTASYSGGSSRDLPIVEIVQRAPELNINRAAGTPRGVAGLWGFCAECEHAATCRAGCTWTAHSFFGRPGNNPYCHHRALVQRARGIRERLELVRAAPGVPFDHGAFELVTEPIDAPWPEPDRLRFSAGAVRWPDGWGGG